MCDVMERIWGGLSLRVESLEILSTVDQIEGGGVYVCTTTPEHSYQECELRAKPARENNALVLERRGSWPWPWRCLAWRCMAPGIKDV